MNVDECVRRLTLAVCAGIFLSAYSAAYAQEEDPSLQVRDLYVIFGSFIAAVAALAVYISRDAILRRKNAYDASRFESQKDRDYEKYHSDWGDDWGWKEEKRGRFGHKESREDDYYTVLGASRDATDAEIKSKYRELAKKSHPDRTDGEHTAAMARINRAYEILSDRQLRRKYDEYLDGL